MIYKNLSQLKEKHADSYLLIGNPIGHSVSPLLHSMFVKGCKYGAVKLETEELSKFCAFARQNLQGFNVTVPHKQEIMKYLDDVDPLALKIGSVNTVKITDGYLTGYNTDITGLEEGIDEGFAMKSGQNVLVLGAGGVARTAVFAAKGRGCNLTIAARDTLKAQKAFPEEKITDIFEVCGSYDIVINCTPCGMKGQEETSPCDLAMFEGVKFVYDMVYNPLSTKFLKQADALKIKCANGLSMLIYQAAAAQKIWGNNVIDNYDEILFQLEKGIIIQMLQKQGKSGIALCGFMGCGKSTVAAMLSKSYGFSLIETDALAEISANMTIPEIFRTKGEQAFRDIESEVIEKLPADGFYVVSLGGGAVIRNKNADAIKKNFVLVFIDVPLEVSLNRAGNGGKRPLLNKSPEEILKLYRFRKEIYSEVCDIRIEGNAEPNQISRKIIYSL